MDRSGSDADRRMLGVRFTCQAPVGSNLIQQTALFGIANSLGLGLLEPRLSHLQAATGGDAGEASMEVTVNVKSQPIRSGVVIFIKDNETRPSSF
jgi:hypothetical protein